MAEFPNCATDCTTLDVLAPKFDWIKCSGSGIYTSVALPNPQIPIVGGVASC